MICEEVGLASESKGLSRPIVKITFDDIEDVRPLLRIGMSVVPTILID